MWDFKISDYVWVSMHTAVCLCELGNICDKPQEGLKMWHKLLLIHNLERGGKGESVKYLIYCHTFETSQFLWLRATNLSLYNNTASSRHLSNKVFHRLEASQDSGCSSKTHQHCSSGEDQTVCDRSTTKMDVNGTTERLVRRN